MYLTTNSTHFIYGYMTSDSTDELIILLEIYHTLLHAKSAPVIQFVFMRVCVYIYISVTVRSAHTSSIPRDISVCAREHVVHW